MQNEFGRKSWVGIILQKTPLESNWSDAQTPSQQTYPKGFGRYHFAENRKFCYYSRGSLNETLTFIQKAKDRNLMEESAAIELSQQLTTLRKRLNAYIRSIGPTDDNSPS